MERLPFRSIVVSEQLAPGIALHFERFQRLTDRETNPLDQIPWVIKTQEVLMI